MNHCEMETIVWYAIFCTHKVIQRWLLYISIFHFKHEYICICVAHLRGAVSTTTDMLQTYKKHWSQCIDKEFTPDRMRVYFCNVYVLCVCVCVYTVNGVVTRCAVQVCPAPTRRANRQRWTYTTSPCVNACFYAYVQVNIENTATHWQPHRGRKKQIREQCRVSCVCATLHKHRLPSC